MRKPRRSRCQMARWTAQVQVQLGAATVAAFTRGMAARPAKRDCLEPFDRYIARAFAWESFRMASARFDVLGIGNAIVDVIARTDDGFLAQQKMRKGTMQLIDEARAAKLYDAMGPAVEMSGGSAANTIVGVASLGARAAYIGKVKDDQIGRMYMHDIRAAGVAFETRPALDGPATGCSYILVTPDGERTMNTHLGAAQELTSDDIDAVQIAASSVIYLEGYLWDPTNAKDAFVKAS